MKRLITSLYLSISLALGIFGVGWSGDLEKGYNAYKRGDYATALKEWIPLAEGGEASIQSLLGEMYRQGIGVPQDDKIAAKWYTLAAEQGFLIAQLNLGVMYERGHGVPQDYKTAVKWYILAAEQGHVDSQINLGVMYALGQGVIEDKVTAHMWANIANSNGNEGGKKLIELLLKQGMTPSQIEKAQDLARECVKKNYKGCKR